MSKSKDPYVEKRIAEIKRQQSGRIKPVKKARRKKKVNVTMSCIGFYMNIDFCPQSNIDKKIIDEANKLIMRRAS